MITQSQTVPQADDQQQPFRLALVRYGTLPQVARFSVSEQLSSQLTDDDIRGRQVVVQTDRGPELGQALEYVPQSMSEGKTASGEVLRIASTEDQVTHQQHLQQATADFPDWLRRIEEWELQLQLIELEWTLDHQRLILYVLNDRDAETTRLALLAAAAGLGIIHVQPVTAEGVVQPQGGGGCGSCGCHS